MLDVSVTRNGAELNSFTGLNDGVIGATGISKIVRLQISLSDTYVGGYRADGVIVSSPTGSTAYSAAAGGPILDPEMEAMIINPICPFTLSNRPIVVPGDKNIIIEVMEKQRTDILLTVDGQYAVELLPRDTIHIGLSEKRALIIRSDRRNFYEVLRTKLNWSGGPDA
jgi:NAD+ kinase